jgi:branched-chain amino acid aminotransferase
LAADVAALRADVAGLLERAGAADALLRLVITRGGRRLALIEPLPEHPPAIRLATVTFAPTRVLDGIKSLSYAGNMLATRLAK